MALQWPLFGSTVWCSQTLPKPSLTPHLGGHSWLERLCWGANLLTQMLADSEYLQHAFDQPPFSLFCRFLAPVTHKVLLCTTTIAPSPPHRRLSGGLDGEVMFRAPARGSRKSSYCAEFPFIPLGSHSLHRVGMRHARTPG